MRVRCKICGLLYEDETHWTICPHRYLEEPPEGPTNYCREHDLFNCPFHDEARAGEKAVPGQR